MKRFRVLVCSHSVPTPERDAGSLRLMNFIDFLIEQKWHVEFLGTAVADLLTGRALRQRAIPVHGPDSIPDLALNGRFDLVFASFWPVAEFVTPAFRHASPRSEERRVGKECW